MPEHAALAGGEDGRARDPAGVDARVLSLSRASRGRCGRARGHLVVANHASHLDFLAIFCAFPLRCVNRIRTLCAADYFASPWRRGIAFLLGNVIPMDRSRLDRQALACCKREIAAGANVVFFPEGTPRRAGASARSSRAWGSLRWRAAGRSCRCSCGAPTAAFPKARSCRGAGPSRPSWASRWPLTGRTAANVTGPAPHETFAEHFYACSFGRTPMTRLRLRMLRLLVHTVGRLSDGINLACRDGMTAGTTLDYIYRNRPSGRSMVGRRLDRIYLSHKSWQAVRERMTLLCEVLAQSVRQMCLRTPSATRGLPHEPQAQSPGPRFCWTSHRGRRGTCWMCWTNCAGFPFARHAGT